MRKIILLTLAISCCYCQCNFYPQDPVACVQLTNSYCIYNEFLNWCMETQNQNLGCSKNLNSKACINQLNFGGNTEKKCIFQGRCQEVNQYHLENLGCDKNYSKFACLSVLNRDCFWNGVCEDSSMISYSHYTQEEIYQFPVTPSLCAKYEQSPCMNNGSEGDYRCVTIYEMQFKELKCSTLGLNEIGCRSILTEQEMCIFDNYQCKYIKPYEIISCSLKLNKLACLSISKPNLMCEWQKQECRTYVINENKQCQDIFNININVCANQDSLCMFDDNNFRCIHKIFFILFYFFMKNLQFIIFSYIVNQYIFQLQNYYQIPFRFNLLQQMNIIQKSLHNTEVTLKQLEDLDCDTPGITRLTCLSIKNKQCTFYKGFCQTLQDKELSEYHCSMQLNQAACTAHDQQFI